MKYLDCCTRRAAAERLPLAPAPRPSPPYRAVGTEPFWTLIIDERDRDLHRRTGSAAVAPADAASRSSAFAGEIYQTPRINVNIVHASCSDGMSDRTYPDRVQVDVDGRRFNGCGGL